MMIDFPNWTIILVSKMVLWNPYGEGLLKGPYLIYMCSKLSCSVKLLISPSQVFCEITECGTNLQQAS